MPKNGIMKRKTEKDILNEYGFQYADLMDLFGVSKQMAFQYLKGESGPSIERLLQVISIKGEELEGQMCRDILANRGYKIESVQVVM